MRRTKRKKQVFIKLVIGVFIFILIACSITIALYLMAVYKPAEYSPKPISREMQEVAVDDAIALVADIHNNIYAEKEFSQTFNSELINKLLLHDDLRKLLEDEFVGSDISLEHPQISLRDGQVIFYVTMNYYSHRVVVSAILKPYIDSKGDMVIDLVKIKSGALGIPMATINDYLMKIALAVKNYTDSIEKKNDDDNDFNAEVGHFIGQSLPDLLNKKQLVFSPVMNKPDEKDISVKLVGISIANQKAVLSFEQQRLK